ncbi:pyridoxal-phosphate dependent enzyme, partial [Bacillus thuringiensis]|nr:pyridoxal-phosphate dependent enzyme [Bacillus thuringiensis]
TIIEPRAGNTGIGLALAALEHDLRVIVCVPEKFSIEKQEGRKERGERGGKKKKEEGRTGGRAKAKEVANEIPKSYSPSTVANEAKPRAY